jgi:hypothetical protein
MFIVGTGVSRQWSLKLKQQSLIQEYEILNTTIIRLSMYKFKMEFCC